MRKIICITLALLAGTECISAQKLVITAELNGVVDGTKFEILQGAVHDDLPPVSVQEVKEGKLTFTLDVDGPRKYIIMQPNTYGTIQLVADKNEIVSIKGEVVNSGNTENPAFNYKTTISGSPTNDLYKQKVPDRDRLGKMYDEYHEANKDIIEKLGDARAKKDKARLKELNDSEAGKKLNADEKAFFTEVECVITKAVSDNKDTFWGPLLMMDQYSYLTKENKSLYDTFSDEAKKSYYGVLAGKEISPVSQEGKAMPDFTVTNWDNKIKTTFRELSKGHKIILLDFWASWCNPCRKEIPNFKKLYAQYKDKGFQVVSISSDVNDAAWKKALQEEKLEWPNYRDADKTIQRLYGVKFFPTIYVIDEKGNCLAENIRGEELAKFLENIFK